MHHRLRLGAVLAAMTLVLLGCSEDPTPKFAPPQTDVPAPTSTNPSPEQTQTPTPQALTPEETVRAWVKARNVTVRTGDSEDVDGLSAPDCETCRDSIDPVIQVYLDGGHYETAGWRVVSTRIRSESPGRAEVSAAVVYAAGETVTEAGAEPVAYDVERHIMVFRLVPDGEAWAVRLVAYLS